MLRVECTCRVCGSTFYRKPSIVRVGNAQFCSRQCALKSRMSMPYREKRIDGPDPERPLILCDINPPMQRHKPGPQRR